MKKIDNKEIETCDVLSIEEELVLDIKPKVDELHGLAELFKALADDTRAKLLYALSLSDLCVCNLAEILGTTQSNVSHHLRYLRAARLVKGQREGRRVYYSLDDDHVKGIIEMGIEHLNHI
ncbi:MAG: ArsR/SmtB family transcription factor [Clostridia bacterium]